MNSCVCGRKAKIIAVSLNSILDLKHHLPVVLVTLQSVFKDDAYIPASKEIQIGCVRTMAVSQKKVCLDSCCYINFYRMVNYCFSIRALYFFVIPPPNEV